MKKSSILFVGKRNQIFGVVFIVVLLALVALGFKYVFKIKPKAAGANCKWLISYGVSHNGAVPEYIGWYNGASNLQHIESLPNFPYNGVGIETWQYSPLNVMHLVMEPNKLGYQAIHDEYKPFIDLQAHGLKPTKLKHNFIMVHLERAGGFYDPNNPTDKATRDAQWANVVDNFANLARVAKEINDSGFPIDGIFLDNEGPYGAGGFWNCGGSYAPACSSTNLALYQEQSRQRGKQIMDAIKPYSYPGFHFMFMHSTDVSCTLDPNNRNSPPGLGTNWVEYANQLLGSFTVGLAESAKGSNVKVVDGGEESYGYLTQEYFTVSKDYRNAGMATQMDGTKLACYFIPPEDRTTVQTWSDLFETAFAMYNKDPADTPGQTPSTIGESMRLALLNTDNYVWFYLEGGTTTIDSPYGTQIGDDWTVPIKQARDAVQNDPSCEGGPTPSPSPSPSVSPSPSQPPSPSPSPSPSSCVGPAAPTVLTATKNAANPTGAIDLAWTDTIADHDGFWFWRSTTAGVFPDNPSITLPDPNMRSYTNTSNIQPDTLYYYKLESYKGSCFSAPIYAQVKTDPVGVVLNLNIQLQGRTDWSTANTHLKIYDSASALVLDKTDVTTNAAGNVQITLPTSMTVGGTYSFYLKPKYFLADYKGSQVLTNPMNLTYAVFKAGDSNDDNIINTADYQILLVNWFRSNEAADFNKDGVVNTADFAWMSQNWLQGS